MSIIKVNTSQDSGSLHLVFIPPIDACILSGTSILDVIAYSSNLKTLSKSIRKTTETSVKIIFKNIKNRN